MLVLVTGGSGSGKSEYAESRCQALSQGRPMGYVATMHVFGEEGRKKVLRHQLLRAGKGFFTIEQPVRIEAVLNQLEDEDAGILIECMSNLTANEMFGEEPVQDEDAIVKRIVDGVKQLCGRLPWMVIVTNNVFEDGINYEPSTMAYIRVLGNINRQLAEMADEVIEVVVGIPIWIKTQE